MKKIFFVVLFFLTCLYFVSAWFFSSKILYLPITHCTPERFVFCGDPSEQGLSFENVTFTTTDGYTLPAWYMPASAQKNDSAILLVHGRTSNKTEGMRYAKSLINAGYDVFAIDMRHPRQDASIISTMGYHEQKDIVAAIDFLEQEKQISNIGVIGFSMGASASIIVMAKDVRVKALVASGGYANAMDALAEQAKIIYGLPRYPLVPMVEKFFAWRGNVDLNDINPEDFIGQISPRPVYIIHGTADKTVGYHHAERLFNAAKQPKQIWKAENGQHTQLWQLDKEKAETSIVSFFNRYLLSTNL